ncbi:hypothetical protein HanPI659440_Chr01g0000011 [Helianthus annuus]|nr:hypothetical protein HanPI659440_Chr01g0000011 [Helianthus annuus]
MKLLRFFLSIWNWWVMGCDMFDPSEFFEREFFPGDENVYTQTDKSFVSFTLTVDATLGWVVAWVGAARLSCWSWEGHCLGWAGDIRGDWVVKPGSLSRSLLVAFSFLFVWSVGKHSAQLPFFCRRLLVGGHKWRWLLGFILGLLLNLGDTRQDWLGGLSFRCTPPCFHTPMPETVIGFRNLVIIFTSVYRWDWVTGCVLSWGLFFLSSCGTEPIWVCKIGLYRALGWWTARFIKSHMSWKHHTWGWACILQLWNCNNQQTTAFGYRGNMGIYLCGQLLNLQVMSTGSNKYSRAFGIKCWVRGKMVMKYWLFGQVMQDRESPLAEGFCFVLLLVEGAAGIKRRTCTGVIKFHQYCSALLLLYTTNLDCIRAELRSAKRKAVVWEDWSCTSLCLFLQGCCQLIMCSKKLLYIRSDWLRGISVTMGWVSLSHMHNNLVHKWNVWQDVWLVTIYGCARYMQCQACNSDKTWAEHCVRGFWVGITGLWVVVKKWFKCWMLQVIIKQDLGSRWSRGISVLSGYDIYTLEVLVGLSRYVMLIYKVYGCCKGSVLLFGLLCSLFRHQGVLAHVMGSLCVCSGLLLGSRDMWQPKPLANELAPLMYMLTLVHHHAVEYGLDLYLVATTWAIRFSCGILKAGPFKTGALISTLMKAHPVGGVMLIHKMKAWTEILLRAWAAISWDYLGLGCDSYKMSYFACEWGMWDYISVRESAHSLLVCGPISCRSGNCIPCKARFFCIPSVGSIISYFWSPKPVSGDVMGGMPPLKV